MKLKRKLENRYFACRGRCGLKRYIYVRNLKDKKCPLCGGRFEHTNEIKG